MPELNLPFGPWKKIFSGDWTGHSASLFKNPDNLLLLVIFEKEGEKVKGVLVLMKKIFLVKGDMARFIATQRRDITILEKRSTDFSAKYVMVGADPIYIPFSPESFSDSIRKVFESTESVGRVIKEVLASYDLQCTDLKSAPDEYVASIFEDPITLIALPSAKSVSTVETKEAHAVPSFAEGFVRPGFVPLGVDSESEVIEVKMKNLRDVIVFGGAEAMRRQTMHVLIEGALLNGFPVIVFDWSGIFSGLSLPNADDSEFKNFKINITATGFPVKGFEAGPNAHADLNLVEAEGLRESLGVGTDPASEIIISKIVSLKNRIGTFADVLNELKATQETRVNTKYQINKALRIITVLQKSSFGALGGKNIVGDLVTPWVGGIGKVAYVSFKNVRPDISKIVAYSIIKSISDFLKSASKRDISVFIAFDSPVIFDQKTPNYLKEVTDLLTESIQNGCGVCIQSQNDFEIPKPIADMSTLRLDTLEQDVAVREIEERPKKARLRPTLSLFNPPSSQAVKAKLMSDKK